MDFSVFKGDAEAVAASDGKKRARTVKAGDLLIIMERHDTFDHIYVKEGEMFQNRFGLFRHSDLIGKPYGSAVRSHTTGKFVRILSPTPELWTLSLKHRTQIVHELDQSFVIFMLGIKPGSVVLESGTGSGAMSTAIMRSLSPNGHLHTIEFNESRAGKAREDFERNGLGHLVTVYHADVCQKKEERGTGTMATVASQLAGKVDAVFLDVPDPWLAVGFARDVLKPDARVATYSPCIEQVMRTCEALKKAQFHSLRTVEVRLKVFDVRKVEVVSPDFGDAPPAPPASTGEAAAPMVVDNGGGEAKEAESASGEAMGDEESMVVEEEGEKEEEGDGEKKGRGKKRKTGGGSGGPMVPYAKARGQMRGHTAFLTFATAGLVSAAPAEKPSEEEKEAKPASEGGGGAAP